ncbi:PREDICTED: uncharacterized protein LOC109327662 [Lupinus angustifolius]|uniref:uncharacterized protein LOC109327662 n=1 Tax=Lupinus angustifolius TaxID=3871 RepID=UPI00092EC02E|nr:PREDICTED: uncharacterized protein LOC109327662 [Lupinus angustifolius]
MPPREEFPAKKLEGAPSEDIGWHFGTQVPEHRNNIKCNLCGKVIMGGITRLKQHIAHYKGQVVGCPRVTGVFRQQTRGSGNIYEQGGSSHASGSDASRLQDIDFNLRSTNIDLVSNRSAKQPKITGRFMDAARKKLREVVGKFIIYECVAMNITRSPWFYNLIAAAAEVSQGVKCPTHYEISTVCLNAKYNNMREWIKTLKHTWKETGVTIMCDGWTYSINHKHIMNFLVYSSKGTVFTNSIDASDVGSRNTDYYFQLLNKIVDKVSEEYVVQIVTDNEKALKVASQKLMEKRSHLYWSACSANCLDLCLEDIGRKNVQKSLDEAKMVTIFIYNHIWTINLMKKYT